MLVTGSGKSQRPTYSKQQHDMIWAGIELAPERKAVSLGNVGRSAQNDFRELDRSVAAHC